MSPDAERVLEALKGKRPRRLTHIAESVGWLRGGDEVFANSRAYSERGWDDHRVSVAIRELKSSDLVEEHMSGAGNKWKLKR